MFLVARIQVGARQSILKPPVTRGASRKVGRFSESLFRSPVWHLQTAFVVVLGSFFGKLDFDRIARVAYNVTSGKGTKPYMSKWETPGATH